MSRTQTPIQQAANVSGGSAHALQGYFALDRALSICPGHKLFTVLAIDWDARQNRRIYSSSPALYPCGGAKPLQHDGEFFTQVVEQGKSRICRNRDECRAAFFDFALIEELGCESAINVPIRTKGLTIGSLNLLHEAAWYSEEMIPALARHASVAATLLTASRLVQLS